MAMIRLTVNARATEVDADPAQPLLWVLRETLGHPASGPAAITGSSPHSMHAAA